MRTCAWCQAGLQPTSPRAGRPREYCSDRCRRAASDYRTRGQAKADRDLIQVVPAPGYLFIRGMRDGRRRVVGYTRVDSQDWARFKHLRFRLTVGYASTTINGRMEYLHRLILGLEPGADLQSDHINRDKLDNRRANLRRVTSKENCANRGGVFVYGRVGLRIFKSHCAHGHQMKGYNLYVSPDGKWHCRTCQRVSNRESKRRIRAQAKVAA